MLVEGIRSNCPVQEQYSVFKAMRKVAQNLLMNDDKYRTLYADNDMVQRKILGRVGGYEFLRGIGFKQGMDDNELVCSAVDGHIVQNAIAALNTHIVRLKQSRHEWDPKASVHRLGGMNGMASMNSVHGMQPVHAMQPPQVQGNMGHLSEEDRMIQEAIRMSREQHVKDKIMEQQRLIDFANRKKESIGPNYGQQLHQQQMPHNGPQFGAFNNKSVNQYLDHEEDDHKADYM